MTLPIKGYRLVQLFSMIVRGLYWHNWTTILPSEYFVEIYTFNLRGLIFFYDNLLLKAPNNIIQKDLGDGVFRYKCTRADDDPGISVWEMSFYNGMMITGATDEYLFFCGLTGPEEIRREDGLYQGNYHYPLSEQRTGFFITDNNLIKKYRFDFYNLINVLKLEKYPAGNEPLFLTKKQISQLSDKLKYKYFLNLDRMQFLSANNPI